VLGRRGTEFARPLQRAVRDLMWECAGVVRSAERLREGLGRRRRGGGGDGRASRCARHGRLRRRGPRVRPRRDGRHRAGDAARRAGREESRGCHQRADFPDTDEALRANLTVDAAGTVARRELPETDPALVALTGELAVAGRLLE
jgi:succinate dehydrogenase / fumarate reductase flavoprotein subunit